MATVAGSLRNKVLVLDDVTTGDLTVTGSVTISGTATTINSTNTSINDHLIELNAGLTGANANDTGLILERGSTGNNVFIGWDESADKVVLGLTTGDGTSTGNLSLTYANMQAASATFTGGITAATNSTFSQNVTINSNLYIGDGNDGYFFNDVNGRTAFTGGDFYFQAGITNFYNYATNQYYGDSSGDNIHFRGNTVDGTGWELSPNRLKVAAAGTSPTDVKVHVGTINSAGSSAIAQFGGFLRAADILFLHDGAGSSSSIGIRYTGGDVDLTAGEGSGASQSTRVNSLKIGSANTVIDTSRNFTANSRLTFGYNNHYLEAGTGNITLKNNSNSSLVTLGQESQFNGTVKINSHVSGIGDLNIGTAISGHSSSDPARITVDSSGKLYLDSTSGQHLYLGWWNSSGADIISEMNFRGPSFKDRNDTAYFLNPAGTGTSLNVAGTITTASHGTSANWKSAYDNYITGIGVSGTTTKTITLTQRDGGTISTTFSDLQGSTADGVVDSISFSAGSGQAPSGTSGTDGTGILTLGRSGSLSDLTVDLDNRYLQRQYMSNWTRVGYGNSGTTLWHKLCTITINGSYKDYSAAFYWTDRYDRGEASIHIHSDNDNTADVWAARFVSTTNSNRKSASDVMYTQSGSTVEIFVKTPAWREFDYIRNDAVTEGTPQITWYDESSTTEYSSQPSNTTAFTDMTPISQNGYNNSFNGNLSDRDNTTYYLNPAGTSKLYNVSIDRGNSGDDAFIELRNTGYTGNITSLRQNADSTRAELNSTERSILIQAGSGGGSTGAEVRLYANQTEGLRVVNGGHVEIPAILRHMGDTDTYMQFTDGEIDFFANGVNGFMTSSGGFVVNPNSGNYDFIVRGDNESNLIYGDASTDRVGIGTASPSYDLDIYGASAGLRVAKTANDAAIISKSTTAGAWFISESPNYYSGILHNIGGTEQWALGTLQGQSQYTLRRGRSGAIVLTALTDGKVGINNNTPQRRFVVTEDSAASAGDNAGILSLTVGSGANTDAKMQFGIESNHRGWIHVVKPGSNVYPLLLNPTGSSNGKVGIGFNGSNPNEMLDVLGKVNVQAGQVWDTTTQGGGRGSIHIDPNSGTTHAGGAITFGASDTSNGTSAQAGIYIRSDGSYGTRMYLSTTDSYASGSKTALYIDTAGVVSSTRSRIVSASDMRASIFYDSSNTDFYVDPVGSSKLYGTLYLGHTNTQPGTLVIYDTGNNGMEIKGTGSNTFQVDMIGTSAQGTLTFNDFNLSVDGNLTATGNGSSGNAFAVNRGSDNNQAFRIQNAGEVVVANNYLYASHTGTAFYSQGTAVFRGGITNDGGNDLSISSGSNYIDFNNKILKDVGGVDLDNGDHIAFYGNDSKDHAMFAYLDDDIRINSYGSIFLSLDSNGNNDSAADFKIVKHAGGTSSWNNNQELLCLRGDSSNGDLIIGGSFGLSEQPYYAKLAIPGAEAAWGANGTSTGQVIIDLPGDLSNYDMLYLEIDVFEYNGKGGSKIIIGTHNWNSGGNSGTGNQMWHNTDVRIVGRFDKEIFLGYRNDGTNNRRCIVLGTHTSSWSYATVHVGKVSGAVDFYTAAIDYTGNWNVTQSTSSSAYTKSPTTDWNGSDRRTLRVHRAVQGNRVYADSDMRAPHYYDLDNTTYYTNPASTSHMNAIYLADGLYHKDDSDTCIKFTPNEIDMDVGGIQALHADSSVLSINNNSANYDFRVKADNGAVMLYTDASANNVGIGTGTPGAALHVSDDRDITAHNEAKGIRLSESAGDWLLSLGVSGVTNTGFAIRDNVQNTYPFVIRETTGNVGIDKNNPGHALDVTGTTRSSNDFRAPIFYDSNNTTYYTNPASTSLINGLQIAGSTLMTAEGATNLKTRFIMGKASGSTSSGELYLNYGTNHAVYVGSGGTANLNVTGNTTSNNFYVANAIYHTGDTDSYMWFDTGDSWKLFCGGQKMIQATEASSGFDYVSFGGTTNSGKIMFNLSSGDGHFDGDLIAYSSTTSSDLKLKENIRDLDGALDKTLQLRGVKFDWKDEHRENDQLGFIAQEIEEVLPEVVSDVDSIDAKEGETHKVVNYAAVVPLLVEAIKELKSEIDDLKDQLNKK